MNDQIDFTEKTYLTEYEKDGLIYGSEVRARSWQEAQSIADNRGNGEKVIGELICSYFLGDN